MNKAIAKFLNVLTLIATLSVLTFAQISSDFLINKNYVPSAYIFNITIAKHGDDFESVENNTAQTKFTSFYTDLNKDCKTEKSDEGGHVSTFCKGPGNYRIHYFDSAMTLEFIAETKDGEFSIRLASQSLTYLKQNSKIEWRLADGKPFAVIMPVYKYQTKDGLIAYPAKVISEKTIVKGLKGFEKIDYEESGKFANIHARDAAYNDYFDITAKTKRIEIPAGKSTFTHEDMLFKGDEKVKYLLKAKKRHRLTITIDTLSYKGEEGPIMYGVVTAPNGESDGQSGGKIFDSITTDGDYEIMIAQNNAKSNATGIHFRITIKMEPIYE